MISMQDQPKISTIITSYNCATTIVQAIESVLAQSMRPEEVIVVDDGSSDDSLSKILSFGDQITVISETNQGPSAARNRGIERASSHWVALLDGDDAWHKEKLALQLAAATDHPEAVVIATDWARSIDDLDAGEHSNLSMLFASDIAVLNRFQTSTVLVRRDALVRAGGFDPDLDSAEDWDLWLRLSQSGPSALIRSPLVFYRDNPSGVSKDVLTLEAKVSEIMDREVRNGYFATGFVNIVTAWHHQRFIIAAILSRDFSQAWKLLKKSGSRGNLRCHVDAFARYTLPFLVERLSRRIS